MPLLAIVVLAVALAQLERPERIQAGDVELHYIERGQGEPVILLHGGQGDYRAWLPHMAALSARYRVIAYSRRYHFPNDNPVSADHSALVDARDLAGLVNALKLGRVSLVGTSYGAFAALAFAADHPDRVRAMVLAEPPVHQWVAGTPRGRELYEDFLTGTHQAAGRAFAAGDDRAAMRILIDEFDGAGAFDRLPEERRQGVMANSRFFKAITASRDPFPNLPKARVRSLRIPALIVKGANTDALHGMVADEVAAVLPNVTRAVIPDAGHGSPRQNPAAFSAAVLTFLSTIK